MLLTSINCFTCVYRAAVGRFVFWIYCCCIMDGWMMAKPRLSATVHLTLRWSQNVILRGSKLVPNVIQPIELMIQPPGCHWPIITATRM